MSYQPGDLMVSKPCPKPDKDGYCDCDFEDIPRNEEGEPLEWHGLSDSRLPLGDPLEHKQQTNVVFLPHSCDEWVIGGPAEIRALIADLQSALDTVSHKA